MAKCNPNLSAEETAKSPTFEIHGLEVTSEAYRNIGQTAFKLKASIHVREPEFQNKSYLLVLHENVRYSYAYVTVEMGRGTLEIYELTPDAKSSGRTDGDEVQVSLIGYVELRPGTLLVSSKES